MAGYISLGRAMDWIRWKMYRLVVWLPSKLGHWEAEHEFKTCPAGERHCQHMHWRPDMKLLSKIPYHAECRPHVTVHDRPRCGICGHRVQQPGAPAQKQTREQPVHTWLPELRDRRVARRLYLARVML